MKRTYSDLMSHYEIPEDKTRVSIGMARYNGIMFGNDENFDIDEFYQFLLVGDKLYKCYYDTKDENGDWIDDLGSIDYKHPYNVKDVSNAYKD